MTVNVDVLLKNASEVRMLAYAPYSRFLVGSCIEASSGALYSGCNVENAAYGLTTCAEASAISAMVSAGEREIRQIAVVTDGSVLTSPCGACRQRIAEFSSPDVPVHFFTLDGAHDVKTISELLPLAFGPGNLGVM